jgi:hypothetical protein
MATELNLITLPERLARSVQNYLNDNTWCGEHWGVVYLMRPNIGTHAISHVALSLRTDHAVLLGEEKPGWFRSPRWRRGFFLNAFQRNRPLHRRQDVCLIRRRFVSYRSAEALFRHPDKAMLIGCEMRGVWMWSGAIKHIRNRFAFIGR